MKLMILAASVVFCISSSSIFAYNKELSEKELEDLNVFIVYIDELCEQEKISQKINGMSEEDLKEEFIRFLGYSTHHYEHFDKKFKEYNIQHSSDPITLSVKGGEIFLQADDFSGKIKEILGIEDTSTNVSDSSRATDTILQEILLPPSDKKDQTSPRHFSRKYETRSKRFDEEKRDDEETYNIKDRLRRKKEEMHSPLPDRGPKEVGVSRAESLHRFYDLRERKGNSTLESEGLARDPLGKRNSSARSTSVPDTQSHEETNPDSSGKILQQPAQGGKRLKP